MSLRIHRHRSLCPRNRGNTRTNRLCKSLPGHSLHRDSRWGRGRIRPVHNLLERSIHPQDCTVPLFHTPRKSNRNRRFHIPYFHNWTDSISHRRTFPRVRTFHKHRLHTRSFRTLDQHTKIGGKRTIMCLGCTRDQVHTLRSTNRDRRRYSPHRDLLENR